MNYVAVLDYDQLDNIPSFLEASEYVVCGVVSMETQSVNLLFANGQYMQIDLSYFEEQCPGRLEVEEFDLSEDGQNVFFSGEVFDVSILWEREGDERVVRSGGGPV